MRFRKLDRVLAAVRTLREDDAFRVLRALEDSFGWAIPLLFTREDARQAWLSHAEGAEPTPPFDEVAWMQISGSKWWRDMATESMNESAQIAIDLLVEETIQRRHRATLSQ